jgi:hypothetical protein
LPGRVSFLLGSIIRIRIAVLVAEIRTASTCSTPAGGWGRVSFLRESIIRSRTLVAEIAAAEIRTFSTSSTPGGAGRGRVSVSFWLSCRRRRRTAGAVSLV